MSRISRENVINADAGVRAMGLETKEQLADEFYRAQPHIFASFLVQKQMGVSLERMAFLIDILFICYQAMKLSGHAWPLITEGEQGVQLAHLTATVNFGADLSDDFQNFALQQYGKRLPEPELLAFAITETSRWLQRVKPLESDKYVTMAALNFVNCVAHVSLPEPPPPVNTTRIAYASASRAGKVKRRS